MDSVRVGVIGVGGMGSFHARTLHALPGVDVVAVSDPDRSRTDALRAEMGASVIDDPFDLIDPGQIDAVVIASPDATHAELTISTIAHGLPTLCEKPLATNAIDAARVVDAEVGTGRRLVRLGFMREHDPAHVQLRSTLAELGSIDYVRAIHRNANPSPRPLDEIVGQSMVHEVHSLRHLTAAEVTWIRVSGSGPANGSYRHIVALCGLSTGAHAVLEFDDGGFAYEVGVEVLTTDGDAVTGTPLRPVVRRDGSTGIRLGTDWFGWFADAYRIQDQAWIDSVRSGHTDGPSLWDGHVAQIVVDAMLDSLASGHTTAIELPRRPGLYD